jgi:hypothetical protein
VSWDSFVHTDAGPVKVKAVPALFHPKTTPTANSFALDSTVVLGPVNVAPLACTARGVGALSRAFKPPDTS